MAAKQANLCHAKLLLIVLALQSTLPVMAAGILWPIAEGGNGHTYQPISAGTLIAWTTADQLAREAGGYLATITSDAENEFVFNLVRDDYSYWYVWFGSNYYGPWLGGYQLPGSSEPADGWAWVTGEPFVFEAWNSGEPSNTAGGLNEDRIHFAGSGRPQAFWNDQISFDGVFGPIAFVVEYEPVTFEAEDAEFFEAGSVETVLSGYSGDGYVALDGQVEDPLGWPINTRAVGPHTLVFHYANTGLNPVPVNIIVNGAGLAQGLLETDAMGEEAWNSLAVCVYLNAGNNLIELGLPAHSQGIALDKLTVLNESMNLMDLRSEIMDCDGPDLASRANALDRSIDTCWYVDSFPESLEVDLGDIYPLNHAKIVYGDGAACQYRIEVRTGLKDIYTLAVDQTEDAASVDAACHFNTVLARYIRLTVTGMVEPENSGAEIAEFQAMAKPEYAAITTESGQYRTIQQAVDAAQDGDVITLQPGLYTGPGNDAINMKGKAITLTSIDPEDELVVTRTIIKGDTPALGAIMCFNKETHHCLLSGLTVTGARAGIYCEAASPLVRHCHLVENLGAGIEMLNRSKPTIDHCLIAGNRHTGVYTNPTGRRGNLSAPVIQNCTIADNLGFGIDGGSPLVVVNSIIWSNGHLTEGVQIANSDPLLSYCCLPGQWEGAGILNHDPLFVRQGLWEPVPQDLWSGPEDPGMQYIAGDYHLQSEVGFWNASDSAWLTSPMSSPCIDAGDPDSDWTQEPAPHGSRLNMGAYGGTLQASLSSL
ncbi:MAG: right-handed parallel beta-helix repeat-containing protein [Phycisphaerae bacterium]|nr:right-handed parallel beta-helix repeat-containing protein [Phycisphaerae bacterium]